MFNTKNLRRFDPTHPGIVWNRTVLFYQKPGRVWNSRGKTGYRLSQLQREKQIESMYRQAKQDVGYRDWVVGVSKAYGALLECGAPAADVTDNCLNVHMRLLKDGLTATR